MAEIPVWMPTRVERFERLVAGTSTRPAVVHTDAGRAYFKGIGNPEGPHALARELVGTQLAGWFGLHILDAGVVHHDGLVDIPTGDHQFAEEGPSFVTRAEEGRPWSGDASELDDVVNTEAFTQLVVFDTWVRNHDRYCFDPQRCNPENVFLSTTGLNGDTVRLMAIDHTHAFTKGTDLYPGMDCIDNVKDEGVYGLYPEFRSRLTRTALANARNCLEGVSEAVVRPAVCEVPAEWEVPDNVRSAWINLLVMRAKFLVDRIEGLLAPYLPEMKLFE